MMHYAYSTKSITSPISKGTIDTTRTVILNIFHFYSRANNEMKQEASDEDSEEENEEGDYTVYECPGLAPVSPREIYFATNISLQFPRKFCRRRSLIFKNHN